MKTKPKINDRATRSFTLIDLVTTDTEEGGIIEGYAAVFNEETNIGGWFIESIKEGAFRNESLDDVAFLVNHDMNKIALARSRRNNQASTLQLTVDSKGLHVRAQLDTKNNTEAQNVYSAVKRGDISGMSFSFIVAGQEWRDLEKDVPKRIITDISRVFEVSAVNFPAYKGTEIYARDTDTLENEKTALENARSAVLVNTELELAKAKAIFKISQKQ